MTALIVPAAVFFAAAGSAYPHTVEQVVEPVAQALEPAAEDAAPCCMEVVSAAPAAASPTHTATDAGMGADSVRSVSASRWRVINIPQLLPIGVAPERGLQVRTILAARSVSAAFPEIRDIGGVRPDGLRWHPNGLALDVMIPNPTSAAGIALGNAIVAYALKNAVRFGLQDAIWRGTYYTPSGPRGGGYGHYDHVHLTTTGGGYPTGGETYLR
jgi:hypothetical protein